MMLTVEHLKVNYGESRVLRDVNLNVPAGQVVCLMGRNGVGKTTLLNTVMGLLRPREGKIYLAGEEITLRLPHERARAGIGYVPQGRGIFPYLTVHENILVGMEAASKRDPVALEEVLKTFPRLKDILSRPAGILSGGQGQQLAIARALVGRPRLLLLDEPTEGIQPSIIDEIENLIHSIREQGNITILLVEQYLDFALRLADYYYVMEKGTIVSQGPAKELNQEVVRDYLAV